MGDIVRLENLAEGKGGVKPLLDEVRKFHKVALRGDYYDSFDVNSRNFMSKSEGTEEFIAEFERLIEKCVWAVEKGPRRRFEARRHRSACLSRSCPFRSGVRSPRWGPGVRLLA